ncbi:MAG: ABC transporter ATP-binding protein [Gammaproteobacteria bacterium]
MIEVCRLTKRFGEVTAVDTVSFDVARGELLMLVGGSGSGKTTLLRMINRLIEPTSGSVRIDGDNVSTLEAHLLRRSIGYVFQQVGLFPHRTVGENIAITPSLLGWDRSCIEERVTALLDLVELDTIVRDRYPSALSGGEQQRVGVARALAAKPKLMLLDEPFGALDPLTRDRLQQSFIRLRKELEITAIFVTHDMAEALLLADRIGVMREGRLTQVGSPRQLLSSPADGYVQSLLETPRRQARGFANLLDQRVDV